MAHPVSYGVKVDDFIRVCRGDRELLRYSGQAVMPGLFLWRAMAGFFLSTVLNVLSYSGQPAAAC